MNGKTIERRSLMGLISAAAMAPKRMARAQDAENTDPLKYLDTAQRLTVKAYVNGAGPFDFLVDTGASSSVITAELADRLGLPRVGFNTLHGIAGAQAVATTRVQTLAVGRRSRRGMTVSVLPRALMRVDGILGLEWLGQASLLLDFRRRRMIVGEALPMPDQATVVVEAQMQKTGLTLIDASIPGRRIVAFVDSGSTTTVGNEAFFQHAIDKRAIVGPVTETELRSVTGQVLQGRSIVMSRLALGKLLLVRVPMVIGPVHTFDFWGMHDEPAVLIGSDILRNFESVAMDVKRGEVRFKLAGPYSNGLI
jgi:predicted aspartyl protease